MELTASMREELNAVLLEYYGARFLPDDGQVRPPTKAGYRAKRDRLNAVKKAWRALDPDTQWHLASGLNAMWIGDVEDRLPDIAPVVDRLLEDMRKLSGAPEQLVGLRRATALLWSAWCASELGGDVPIGRVAITEIGKEISSLFRINAAEAERRVHNALRDMEKDGSLARRGTTRRD